jgi:hypothetical protein
MPLSRIPVGVGTNLVGTNEISNGAVTAAKFAPNAVSTNTIASAGKVLKFSYGNAAPNQQPINTSFTLSAAEAPIGSWVAMSLEVLSGNSAGQQYCYLYQNSLSTSNAWITAWVYGWYWYEVKIAWFYIGSAADRTFHVSHGTIASTNNNDGRYVYYHGYAKVTQ